MDAERLIMSTLTKDPAVSSKTKNITAMVMPQKVVTPSVTFYRVSTSPMNVLCGGIPAEYVHMQVDIWGKDYQDTVDLFRAVNAAITGTGKAEYTDRQDWLEDTKYYRITAEYMIFQEA